MSFLNGLGKQVFGLGVKQIKEMLGGSKSSKKKDEQKLKNIKQQVVDDRYLEQQEKRIALKYAFPASIKKARMHRTAVKFGYNPPEDTEDGKDQNQQDHDDNKDHQTDEEENKKGVLCPCCNQKINTQQISMEYHTTDPSQQAKPYKLTSNTSLFFSFVKMTILYLIIVAVFVQIYSLATNIIYGEYCTKNQKQCKSNIFGVLSTYNKLDQKNIIDLFFQDILCLTLVLYTIIFFIAYRRMQYELYDQIDKQNQSQDDFTIFIQNIPVLDFKYGTKKQDADYIQFDYEMGIKQVFQQKIKIWLESLKDKNINQFSQGTISHSLLSSHPNIDTLINQQPIVTTVSLCFDTRQIQKVEDLREELMKESIKAYKKMQSAKNEQSKKQIQEKIKYINSQIKQLNNIEINMCRNYAEDNSPAFNISRFLGKAFVSFQYQHYRERIMHDYQNGQSMIQYDGENIKLHRATNPTDILWSNMKVQKDKRRKNMCISFLLIFAVIICVAMVLVYMDILKKNYVLKDYKAPSIVKNIAGAVVNEADLDSTDQSDNEMQNDGDSQTGEGIEQGIDNGFEQVAQNDNSEQTEEQLNSGSQQQEEEQNQQTTEQENTQQQGQNQQEEKQGEGDASGAGSLEKLIKKGEKQKKEKSKEKKSKEQKKSKKEGQKKNLKKQGQKQKSSKSTKQDKKKSKHPDQTGKSAKSQKKKDKKAKESSSNKSKGQSDKTAQITFTAIVISYLLTFASSYITSFLNIGIQFSVDSLTNFQQHQTRTSHLSSKIIKLVITQFVNTILIYYLISVFIIKPYLSTAGLVLQVSILLVITSKNQIIKNAFTMLAKWWKIRQLNKIWQAQKQQNNAFITNQGKDKVDYLVPNFQVYLNRQIQLPHFDMAERYSFYLVHVYACLFYSYLVPLGVPVVAIVFFIQYWIDKFNMFNNSSQEFQMSFILSRTMLKMFEGGLLVFTFGNLLFSIIVHNHQINYINGGAFVISLIYMFLTTLVSRKWEKKIFFGNYQTFQTISYSQCLKQHMFKKTYWLQNPVTLFCRQVDINNKTKYVEQWQSDQYCDVDDYNSDDFEEQGEALTEQNPQELLLLQKPTTQENSIKRHLNLKSLSPTKSPYQNDQTELL